MRAHPPSPCLSVSRISMLTDSHPRLFSVLLKAGFVQSPEGGFAVEQFVNTDITTLV